MTYDEIFNKTKEAISDADVSGVKGHLAVEIDITGEGAGAFYIEIKDGKADAQPYEYYDRDCKLITTGENFLSIMDGSLDAVKAYSSGKLKVEGNIGKALEFSKIAESARKARAAKEKKSSKAAAPSKAPAKAAPKSPAKTNKTTKKK